MYPFSRPKQPRLAKQVPRVKRTLQFEGLERRYAMTAEGQSHPIDLQIATHELAGTLSGTIQWGDGTSSPAVVQNPPAASSLKFRFDYSLDTQGFFTDPSRRALFQTVADSLSSKFSDSLSAIVPQSGDSWDAKFKSPATGLNTTRTNLSLAANEFLVFVGARDLDGFEGGLADRGGYSVQSTRPSFVTTVQTRGQSGVLASPATDVAPWGGSIAFDSSQNWYFGSDPANLQPNQLDFVTVASHELMHVMGFGTTSVWDSKISNSRFVAPNTTAVFGNSIPLADADHFANNLKVDGRKPTMTQIINPGERLLPGRLDLAGLQDIGWQLIPQTARVTGSHTYGDDGSFPISIQINGSKLGRVTTSTNASITNASPTLSPITNKSAVINQPISLAKLGLFTDPGFGISTITPRRTESFTYRISWGDGTPEDTGPATITSVGSPGTPTSGFFDASHTYATAGTYTATARITDDEGAFSQQQFLVTVSFAGKITLSSDKSSISEAAGAGAAVLTITRSGASTSNALTVQLASSYPSEATLPAFAIIPAGAFSTTVSINAVDDNLFDGTQTVIFTPTCTGYELTTATIQVTDYQPLVLTPSRTELNEDIPEQSTSQVTVAIRSPAPTGGVIVQLSSTPTGILSFPASVLIPSGATQATFSVVAINDQRPSNPRTVDLIASGNGLISARYSFVVSDLDPAIWTNPNNRFDIDNSGNVNPLDVLYLIDEINRNGSRILDPIADADLLFVDPNRDGALDPLDVLLLIDELNRRP
ncbi:MAG: hypothetical protein RL240_1588 [Planctomycetota bacterium]